MNISQEEYERLIAYFESRLSVEEELAFLKEVTTNDDLKEEFDWEFYLRNPSLIGRHESTAYPNIDTPFESADEHIRNVAGAISRADTKLKKMVTQRTISFGKAARVAAAFLILAGVSISSYYLLKRKSPAIVETIPKPSTDTNLLPSADTIKKSPVPVIVENPLALYDKHYRKYKATTEDPIEVSKYLYAYLDGKYDDILAAGTSDIGVKGDSKSDQRLQHYLLFYKGLSHLEMKHYEKAIYFLKQINTDVTGGDLHEQVNWYLALSYLAEGETPKARSLLQKLSIQKKNTPIRRQAGKLALALQ